MIYMYGDICIWFWLCGFGKIDIGGRIFYENCFCKANEEVGLSDYK